LLAECCSDGFVDDLSGSRIIGTNRVHERSSEPDSAHGAQKVFEVIVRLPARPIGVVSAC
jgi:hypothetical protein